MSVMKFVTLAVMMASVQGAPQFPNFDLSQFQQFLDLASSNGVNLPPLPPLLQDLVSKLPTGTASGRADLSDEDGSSEEILKHYYGSYSGGYSKPYYGGYTNNYYNPYNSYNPYAAYNPYTTYNPYNAYNPYAYNGQIGTITGTTSTSGTTTGTTGTTGTVTPVRTDES